MDKKTFTCIIFGITAIVVLLLSPVACTMYQDKLIVEAIKNGADPILTRCAVSGTTATASALCNVRQISK